MTRSVTGATDPSPAGRPAAASPPARTIAMERLRHMAGFYPVPGASEGTKIRSMPATRRLPFRALAACLAAAWGFAGAAGPARAFDQAQAMLSIDFPVAQV